MSKKSKKDKDSEEKKDKIIYNKWLQSTFLDGIIDDYEKCVLASKRLQNVIDNLEKSASRKDRDNALLKEVEKLKKEKILK